MISMKGVKPPLEWFRTHREKLKGKQSKDVVATVGGVIPWMTSGAGRRRLWCLRHRVMSWSHAPCSAASRMQVRVFQILVPRSVGISLRRSLTCYLSVSLRVPPKILLRRATMIWLARSWLTLSAATSKCCRSMRRRKWSPCALR